MSKKDAQILTQKNKKLLGRREDTTRVKCIGSKKKIRKMLQKRGENVKRRRRKKQQKNNKNIVKSDKKNLTNVEKKKV